MQRTFLRNSSCACVCAGALVFACGANDKKPGSPLDVNGGATGSGGDTATSGGAAGKGGTNGNGGDAAHSGGTNGKGGAAVTPQAGGNGNGNGNGGAAPTMRPEDVCKGPGGCPPGIWVDVSPANVSLTEGSCGNFGAKTVQVDPHRPQDVYAFMFCNGLYKSTDYGQTWNGPINKGTNGAAITDCAGGVSLGPTDAATPPLLFVSCIRGSGLGFWVSTDGGNNFTQNNVAPAKGGTDQQFYPPVVDPYNSKHLLMAGHAVDLLVESTDAGKNWAAVHTDPAMAQNGGTSGMVFIDTGDAATTAKTWLWLAAMTGGKIGTWRTTDGGTSWNPVDSNEHVTGATQTYQPDTSGVIFMSGVYSNLGWGVLRSTDFGKTWAHVGNGSQETIVFGTSRFLYAMYGWAIGGGAPVAPSLEVGAQPGTGKWETPATPAAMVQGPAQAAVTNDGKNNIIITASYQSGLWRYVEPAN